MGSKRKRSGAHNDGPPLKRPSSDQVPSCAPTKGQSDPPSHPVLRCYYRRITTLREYLLAASLSTKARKRVARAGVGALFCSTPLDRPDQDGRVGDVELGKLLDSTLVGLGSAGDVAQLQALIDGQWRKLRETRMAKDFRAFSQYCSSTDSTSASAANASPRSWANRQREVCGHPTDLDFPYPCYFSGPCRDRSIQSSQDALA
jgi:hypothetical protein